MLSVSNLSAWLLAFFACDQPFGLGSDVARSGGDSLEAVINGRIEVVVGLSALQGVERF